MSNITKEAYTENIKPLIDILIKKLEENKNSSEWIFAIDTFAKIIKAEFEPEELLKILKDLTPLQIELAKKNGFEEKIYTAKDYLEKNI